MPRPSAAYCGWRRWGGPRGKTKTRFLRNRIAREKGHLSPSDGVRGGVTLILDSRAGEQHNAYTISCGGLESRFFGEIRENEGAARGTFERHSQVVQ